MRTLALGLSSLHVLPGEGYGSEADLLSAGALGGKADAEALPLDNGDSPTMLAFPGGDWVLVPGELEGSETQRRRIGKD